jgi:hypothetical protein
VDKDHIDASLGLAFSLKLFERYKQSGMLQSDIHGAPGIRGRCTAYLQLVGGHVTACTIQDSKGKYYPASQEMLLRLDKEKGPFEWRLTMPSSPAPVAEPRTSKGPIPRQIARLDLEAIATFSSWQKMVLAKVYQSIDGQHSVEEIKGSLPFSPVAIDEALQVLSKLKVIVVK